MSLLYSEHCKSNGEILLSSISSPLLILWNSDMPIGEILKNKWGNRKNIRNEGNEWNVKTWRRTCSLSFFGLCRDPSAWSKSPSRPFSGEAMIMGPICMCKVQVWAQVQRKLVQRRRLLLRFATFLLPWPGSSSTNYVLEKMERYNDFKGEFANIHPGQYSPVKFPHATKDLAEV